MVIETIIRAMEDRDPLLRSQLETKQYQEELHRSYMELSQNISALLKPPTPENSSRSTSSSRDSESTGEKSKKKKRKTSKLSRANSTLLEKYRLQAPTPSVRGPSRFSNKSTKPKSKPIKTPRNKPSLEAPISEMKSVSVLDETKEKYCIRYSQVLDIFKRKIYRDIIRTLGIDINCLEDPSLVEIDLAWCRMGSFILESRENSMLSFAQFLDETASVVDDRDERMSVYSSYTNILPPHIPGSFHAPGRPRPDSRLSDVMSVRKERLTQDVPPTGRNKTSNSSDDKSKLNGTSSKLNKLPVIGEDAFN